ncbi:sel1 repeat family protein, partial [Mesorhizobium sp. M2D.F.Ca.ET.160.01.1.1]
KIQAAYLAKDYAGEFRQLTVLANMGNLDAQGYLGGMYWRGEGTAQNDEQAVHWWRKSADGGNAEAEAALSQAYSLGRGVKKDNDLAVSLARKAADKNNANGEYQLGVF